ncbi:hypothetical protein EJ02DRAFT_345196 [Clathrospora elynae]|uniref:chitinase n=1 Tax=Clathrospora elynae TaxID=706981 RepID=A0A6A5SS79_9PLEO|nr:hypothetical protein EJ02DRAFT_345196 [Clathrospora elynae]
MGCSFISGEGGKAGSCTNSPGVLSNREIKKLIKDEGITPYFNETAMVKYFTYGGGSWVGYDDAQTYALKEAFADDHCLGGIMIWSINFDDATGIGLGGANNFTSPESATVIPMTHTTVPRGQTFTLDPGVATDLPRLPNGGNQNTPQGPGADKCEQCSFFRLITSTCCGTGGSVGNPILIPAGVRTPMDIPLPPGFVPPQSFRDADGNLVPANQPLPRETIIPQGTIFTQPFVIAPGSSLREGEGEDQNSNSSNLVWLSPEIWNDPNPNVQCMFPCTFVLLPYTSFTTTIDYPRITVTESGSIKTTLTFPPLTVSSWAPTTIVVSGRNGCTSTNPASCTNTTDNHRTSTVAISRSTTWPWVTYTSSGPQPGLPPGSIGPDEEDPVDEDDEEFCLLLPKPTKATSKTTSTAKSTTTSTSTEKSSTSTSTSTTSTKASLPTPDFAVDEVKCYDSGQWTRRARMIDAVDGYCEDYMAGHTISQDWNPGTVETTYTRVDSEVTGVKILVFVEATKECEWKVDVDVCKNIMRKMIDACDTNGENRKQGGRVVGDCLTWRLDPNSDL